MLSTQTKTQRPTWAEPFNPSWEQGQWIVRFPCEEDAREALDVMQRNVGAPQMSVAPDPENDNLWYVGVL